MKSMNCHASNFSNWFVIFVNVTLTSGTGRSKKTLRRDGWILSGPKPKRK